MKFIFDFDDVLFKTTECFKKRIIEVLGKYNISRTQIEEYWKRERLNQFSVKKMLTHFSLDESLYEEIMSQNKNFINQEMLEIVKKIGKNNCYLITYGEEKFQLDKIDRSGATSLFKEIFVVPSSKKEIVEKICAQHKDEEIVFVDDKIYNFQDLDLVKYSNLKTVLYDEKGLEKLRATLPQL